TRIGQARQHVAPRLMAQTLELETRTERGTERTRRRADHAHLRRVPAPAGPRPQVERADLLTAPRERNGETGTQIAGLRAPLAACAPRLQRAGLADRVQGDAVAVERGEQGIERPVQRARLARGQQ